MLHQLSDADRDKIGYSFVITDPQEAVLSNGETLVMDNNMWYNCHPKPLEACAMRDMFPQGGYGVRWKL